MKTSPVSTAIAALLGLFFAPLAFAQTVQFNKTFVCNGEHQQVSSCFDDSDGAGCMVFTRTGPCAAASPCRRSKIAAT